MQPAANLQFDDVAGVTRAENVCLASDEFVLDRSTRGTRTGPTLKVVNRVRGCATELALLDGHRLSVRTRRGRSVDRRYVVDLRFVDEVPVARRTLAWRCWLGSVACVAVAALWPSLASSPAVPSGGYTTWLVSIGGSAIALAVGAVAFYRTHETLQFRSVDGQVTLAEAIGGLGCLREAMPFSAAIARRIAAARAEVSQTRQQFLRDQLREHRRLFEDGVLTNDAYEAGKRRILQAHG